MQKSLILVKNVFDYVSRNVSWAVSRNVSDVFADFYPRITSVSEFERLPVICFSAGIKSNEHNDY